MATRSHRETAKIYQFPVKGRTGVDRKAVEAKQLHDQVPDTYADCAFGGCWYHEAALHDVDALPQR
jgi:hypothetical protein